MPIELWTSSDEIECGRRGAASAPAPDSRSTSPIFT
jgi:hypothetical protein